MAFIAIKTARGKGKREFEPLGEPEVLHEGPLHVVVGDSALSAIVTHGGAKLFVHLDESRGNIDVRPFGDDVERYLKEHGVTGVELDARLLQDGATVAGILDENDEGTLYRYRIEAQNQIHRTDVSAG